MFERYTEKARRVIFFARYEASEFGSPCIETEHILLGLLREDKALFFRLLPNVTYQVIHQEVTAHTVIKEKVATSVDLPLSDESKRVLAYSAEEAERLHHQHIGTEHLATESAARKEAPGRPTAAATRSGACEAAAGGGEAAESTACPHNLPGACKATPTGFPRHRGNSRNSPRLRLPPRRRLKLPRILLALAKAFLDCPRYGGRARSRFPIV